MLFGLFGARNASTNTPLEVTEDDTFTALRRVSLQELERRLEATQISDILRRQLKIIHYQRKEDEKLQKRYDFINRWVPFYFHPTSYYQGGSIRVDILINGTDWGTLFAGTGWTADDYVAELNKIFDKEYIEEVAERRARGFKSTWWAIFSGLVAGCVIWFVPAGIISNWVLFPIASFIGIGSEVIIKEIIRLIRSI